MYCSRTLLSLSTRQGRPFQTTHSPCTLTSASHIVASVEGYESVDGKFVRRERDHDRIIVYDVKQLFWYSEGIAHIALTDKVRLTFMIWTNWC